MANKTNTCKKCGRNDLRWKQSKAGKWYLTYDEGVAIGGESGRIIKTIYPMHECCVRDGELTERRATLILCGIITTTDDEMIEAQHMDIANFDSYDAKYPTAQQ
tara:strand:- start:754 stop:1065 length:312 start_codon:yes stop_codon:yes gene_type:complete